MRIGIIGGGVSGLVAAHLLHERHEITVFESRDRVGGHVNTVNVEESDGRSTAVDTGFIVYNELNYPLFARLLAKLGVATQHSNMSFGVRSDRSGMEYSSATLGTLFAQRRNVLRPGFHSMLRNILRFNREAGVAVQNGAADMTLGEYLEHGRFSPRMAEHYLLPMGSALWSVPRGTVLEMPAEFFVRFFENHGMLNVHDQPQWRVIQGGSARYVEALTAPFRSRIRTSAPVERGDAKARPRRHRRAPLRSRHLRLSRRPGAATAVRSEPARARNPHGPALPGQRGRATHRHLGPTTHAQGLGFMELPCPRGARNCGDGHVQHEPSPNSRVSAHILRVSERDGARRPRLDPLPNPLQPPRLHPRRSSGPGKS